MINGKNYRVPALQNLNLEVQPASAMSYSVFSQNWGWLRQNRSTRVAANETVTITIR